MSNIRENVFKKRKPRSEVVKPACLSDSETPEVEVRVMTVGQRAELIAATMSEDGERDAAVFQARVVIETVFVPGTDDRVFRPEDQDALKDMPSDVLDELAEPALRINGLIIGSVAVAEKN